MGNKNHMKTHESKTRSCSNYKALSEMVGMQMYKTASLIKTRLQNIPKVNENDDEWVVCAKNGTRKKEK